MLSILAYVAGVAKPSADGPLAPRLVLDATTEAAAPPPPTDLRTKPPLDLCASLVADRVASPPVVLAEGDCVTSDCVGSNRRQATVAIALCARAPLRTAMMVAREPEEGSNEPYRWSCGKCLGRAGAPPVGCRTLEEQLMTCSGGRADPGFNSVLALPTVHEVVNLEPGVPYRFAAVVLVDHTAGAADGWATGDVVWESGMLSLPLTPAAPGKPVAHAAASWDARSQALLAQQQVSEYDRGLAGQPTDGAAAALRELAHSVSADGQLLSRAELTALFGKVMHGRPPPLPTAPLAPHSLHPTRRPRAHAPRPSPPPLLRWCPPPSPSTPSSASSAAPSRPRSGSCERATPHAAPSRPAVRSRNPRRRSRTPNKPRTHHRSVTEPSCRRVRASSRRRRRRSRRRRRRRRPRRRRSPRRRRRLSRRGKTC
jgi:hypothetical protein